MDMTFNIGADAYKKIIIYDNLGYNGGYIDEYHEQAAVE